MSNASSLQFNGLNRYAKLSTLNTLKNMTAFTWLAWVKPGPLSTSSQQRAYVERQGTGSGIRFAATPYKGRLRFELGVTDGKSDTNYDYKYTWDNRWHHIGFVGRITGASPTYEMYLDGTMVATGTLVKGSGVNNVSNTTPLGSVYLGNHSLATVETFPSDRYWDGKIDEILIFNTAKNQSDILTYASGRAHWNMSDTEMFAYWRFDENTGTTTVDADNAGHTGTLYQSDIASSALWVIDRPFLSDTGAVDVTVPATPTLPGSPTTAITADGFTASWNAATDNIYVQTYELNVSLANTFLSYTTYVIDPVTSALTYSVTGLLPATNYFWRVRATDAALNNSAYAATQSLTTGGSGDVTPPSPPTALNATSLTSSSFTLSYTASVSGDTTGYKVDVATDASFNTYLTGYRNKDVGLVLTTGINGTAQLTTYYLRVRAYDAAGNESASSTTLIVQTPTAPDVIAPIEVVLDPATSLASRSFTANWEASSDNVGVTKYELDVSTDIAFGSFLGGYSAKNVGNVLAASVTNLAPLTTYYYRVRAFDAAGNASANQATPMTVTTTDTTVEEGGFLMTLVQPLADAWTDSTSTGTNHGSDTSLTVVGTGAANSKNAFLLFDLSGIVGTIQSATLNIFVTDASAGSINITATNTTFVESTVTWLTQPTVGGSVLSFTPSVINQWYLIDISSLLLAGGTTYTIKIATNSVDQVLISSKENASNQPFIDLEHDPSNATNLQDMLFADLSGVITNYCTNPNFEANVTTGWTSLASATLSVDATHGVNGGKALKVITGGTTPSGATFGSAASPPAVLGSQFSIVLYASGISGGESLGLAVQEYNASNALLTTSTVTTTVLTTSLQRIAKTYTCTQATTAYIVVRLANTLAAAITFFVDNVLIGNSLDPLPYFDGTTSGALWNGTANLSTSKYNAARTQVDSTYIGDANNNNTVRAMFKRTADSEWIWSPAFQTTVSVNHATKRATSVIGAMLGTYNNVTNPSFETNLTGWTNIGTATSVQDNNVAAIAGAFVAKVTTLGTVDTGIASNNVISGVGVTWGASAYVLAPIGKAVKVVLQAIAFGGSVLGTSTITYGTNAVIGDGTWYHLATTYTTPASTVNVRVAILTDDTNAGIIYVDGAMINAGLWNDPYRDGDMDDAIWEGPAHNSTTGLIYLPLTGYDYLHEYTDPDGMVEAAGGLVANIAESYVTPKVPDNVTTTNTLVLTPTTTTVDIFADYLGDDNNSMTAVVEYRRTDMTNWAAVPASINRTARTITASVDNLVHGTNYTVRVTMTDADGVNGAVGGVVTNTVTTLTVLGAALGSSRILFDGFTLFDALDQTMTYGVVKHNAFGLPSRRVQVEDLPLVDGAIELQNVWGKREISMTGFISGDTMNALEDNKNALKRALAPRMRPLIIDTLSTNGRYYTATCESLDIEQEGANNNTHLMWDATFVCADPFAYEISPMTMPATTVLNNGTFVVNNDGDIRADVMLKLSTTLNKATTLTVINNTTGERITPQTTIQSGDMLVIDAAQYSLTKNGVQTNYSGTFIRLNPGGNTFLFILSATSGTPSLSVELQWRHKYL